MPRFAPGRTFAGYIGSCIDITDVKHTLEASLASQKLETVGQLASGIAHDFNNLLGGILASAELGLAEHAERASPEEELKRIRTAAIRGGEIVRQLMIYGGNESPAYEPVDVSVLVEEMLHLLKISISKHAILETELDEGLPAVHANPAQIRQVVMNLITNASEAIGERRRSDPGSHDCRLACGRLPQTGSLRHGQRHDTRRYNPGSSIRSSPPNSPVAASGLLPFRESFAVTPESSTS